MPMSSAAQAIHLDHKGLVAVDGRVFPLEAVEIRSRAGAGIAWTILAQSYRNPYKVPLEVLYTLPLPADGAVVAYTIRLGERVIRGEIERREDARDKYRQALMEGRTAGLLEQERSDTFTQSLGSLPPGVPVSVEIEVLHPLAFLTGGGSPDSDRPQWEYRFPTVVGVRYEGAPGRVPDAELLDVDRADDAGTPVRASLDLLIFDGSHDSIEPRSSSHDLLFAPAEGGTRTSLATSAYLDRDLVVCWRAARATVAATLLEGPGLPGDDGRYALLTVTPPEMPQVVVPRDLTLLIDASGSMVGAPLECAKRIAAELVNSLGPVDRFEILAFASSVERLTPGIVDVTVENLHRARRRLTELTAGGGTEMVNALHASLIGLRAGSQRQVVLLTDGYIGFEQEAIAKVLDLRPASARLHVVGIGAAPNRSLTRGAARAGRGLELIVNSGDDVVAAGGRLCRATVAPILTNVSVTGTAVLVSAPERPMDVYAGSPLVTAIELRPDGGEIVVSGTLSGVEPWEQRLSLAEAAAARPAHGTSLPVGALFGRERIEDCEMRLAAAPPSQTRDHLREIEVLGLRHRVPSRQTSLVAVSEEPFVDPREPRRRQRLCIEMPADVSAEGVGYSGMAMHEITQHLAQAPRRLHADFGAVDSESKIHFSVEEASDVSYCETADFYPACGISASSPAPGHTLDLTQAIHGWLVEVGRDHLVVEFEAPVSFDTPAGSVEIFLSDERLGQAKISAPGSTRPGPTDAGLTVRLQLTLSRPSKRWDRIRGAAAERLAAIFTPAIRWKAGNSFVVVVLEGHP